MFYLARNYRALHIFGYDAWTNNWKWPLSRHIFLLWPKQWPSISDPMYLWTKHVHKSWYPYENRWKITHKGWCRQYVPEPRSLFKSDNKVLLYWPPWPNRVHRKINALNSLSRSVAIDVAPHCIHGMHSTLNHLHHTECVDKKSPRMIVYKYMTITTRIIVNMDTFYYIAAFSYVWWLHCYRLAIDGWISVSRGSFHHLTCFV